MTKRFCRVRTGVLGDEKVLWSYFLLEQCGSKISFRNSVQLTQKISRGLQAFLYPGWNLLPVHPEAHNKRYKAKIYSHLFSNLVDTWVYYSLLPAHNSNLTFRRLVASIVTASQECPDRLFQKQISEFVFERRTVRIPEKTPATKAEVSHGFLQLLHPNSEWTYID
jgi:hypothetical protein